LARKISPILANQMQYGCLKGMRAQDCPRPRIWL
jgi:hypothetical protein